MGACFVKYWYEFTRTPSSPVLASSHPPRIDSESQTNESKALVNSYGLSPHWGCGCRLWWTVTNIEHPIRWD